MKHESNQRDPKGRFASTPHTAAIGRAGKKVSPWRFGVPWLKLPKRPNWVK